MYSNTRSKIEIFLSTSLLLLLLLWIDSQADECLWLAIDLDIVQLMIEAILHKLNFTITLTQQSHKY